MGGSLRERLEVAFADAKKHGRTASQSDLAKRLGISRASVSDWFSGKTKSLKGENLNRAAEIMGCDPNWLATGRRRPEPPRDEHPAGAPILAWEHDTDLPAGDYVQIPRFEVRLAAGKADEQRSAFQLEIEQVRSAPMAFRADWIRQHKLKPSKLVAMEVSGDSMEERLHDGDAVVIDTSQTEVIDGKVYALWYDGGERVKRLYRRPGGGLIIHSDNRAKYPQLTLTADEAAQVRIIGRVVHLSGEGGL
jgi:phage repressor protein C with HTH and peptisase S24 domain